MQITIENVGALDHNITVKNIPDKWLNLIIERPGAGRTTVELGMVRNQALALAGALIAVASQIKE